MHSRAAIVGGLLLSMIVQPSLACDSAQRASPQSITRFYQSESFGRLGVKGPGDHVYIVNEYRCYDFSFLRNKNLSIYFNNAARNENAEPTYVGAVIVRTFSKGSPQGGQYTGYLYRNALTKQRSTSSWAHRPDLQDSERDSRGAAAEFTILSDEYDPDEALTATSSAGLDHEMQLSTSRAVERLRQWHALVVTPDSGGFRVLYNSARSDGRWQIGLGSSALAQGYLIVRNYLIKYQPSANPRPDAFFKAGASDADCVYIRLVAPGDTLSRFALRRVQGSSDIITLKMKSDAACFAS